MGVDVSITYPSEGLLLYSVPDSQLLTGVFEIYNDWLAELILSRPKQQVRRVFRGRKT